MVIDFSAARKTAIDHLQLTNTVAVLSAGQKKELSFSRFPEVALVRAEILLPDEGVASIELHICFTDEFPTVLPKVYLCPRDYEWIRYIPHVDTNRKVCTLDEDALSLDINQPGRIAKQTLDSALKIIEDGLARRNTEDFADEFVAYWNNSYDTQDEVSAGITMIENTELTPGQQIEMLYLEKAYIGYNHIIHDNAVGFTRMKRYLQEIKHPFREHHCYYLGGLQGLQPPFNATNGSLLEIVKTHYPDKIPGLTRFVNKDSYPKFVLFSLGSGGQNLFFGWRIFHLKTIRNGYRRGSLTNMDVFTGFQKKDPVRRIQFEQFTRERLRKRTDRKTDTNKELTLCFAGLGSIGSNLVHYLMPLAPDHCVLLDPEVLTLENTPRHLLGVAYAGYTKTGAMEVYLRQNNPLLSVTTIAKSVIKVLTESIDTIKECDFLFVAIGKTNVEEYIVNALKLGVLDKPAFILWVEPYLIGAHCLLIRPGHAIDYKTLYHNALFKGNIISEKEYADPKRQFSFKEAGCQSSYIPYGMQQVTLFLSALIPEVYKAMETTDGKNLHIAWRGNEPQRIEHGIDLSEAGSSMATNTIRVNEL